MDFQVLCSQEDFANELKLGSAADSETVTLSFVGLLEEMLEPHDGRK